MKIFKNVTYGFILTVLSAPSQMVAQSSKVLDKMRIDALEPENRSISFTNKEAAYYYMQSHVTNHPEYAWFEGMNVSKNRIFQGYDLYSDGEKLNNSGSKVEVYPYKMFRQYQVGLKEELWMFDNKNIIEVSLSGEAKSIGIELKGNDISIINKTPSISYFKSMAKDYIIGVSAKMPVNIDVKGNFIVSDSKSQGFFIAVGKNIEEVSSLIQETRKNNLRLKEERITRMENLLTKNVFISSVDPELSLALNWLEITMDQLVTKQQGYGIYAGLPWFNEYWGRDEFISFPGAVLVTGQFDIAKKILLSFAKYQDINPSSKFFGRVPNIVNPQNIDYHTTDGTPRFIIELQDYVKYSGDTSIIKELYSNIKNSIEGPMKYWMDERGYLLHEDNETWMDARDQNLVSYSPRGSRANDIQALWYKQLLAGVYFADYMKDESSSQKWKAIALKVRNNFEKDFTDPAYPFIADRLTKDGKQDFSLRPNQLFALDMIENAETRSKSLDKVWRELVYPWGVATLNKQDILFHPFHRTKDYHKDAAYHNGTIWTWLNGMAMQRMLEAEKPEIAYQLFKNVNQMVLTKGVVGGLSENLDAFPHKGQNFPVLTGTYLQAWSNAEQLRIWYQYFLGIRPDMISGRLHLSPRLPNEIKGLTYSFIIGNYLYRANYSEDGKTKIYSYNLGDKPLNITIDIFPYEKKEIVSVPNGILTMTDNGENLQITLTDTRGRSLQHINAEKSKQCTDYINQYFGELTNVPFASPDELENHKTIKDVSQ